MYSTWVNCDYMCHHVCSDNLSSGLCAFYTHRKMETPVPCLLVPVPVHVPLSLSLSPPVILFGILTMELPCRRDKVIHGWQN